MYTWENLNRQYSWYLRRASSTSKISDSKFSKFRFSKIKRKSNFSCQNFLFRHMPGFSALLGTLKLSNLSLCFILWHFMPFYLSMYLSFLCHFWYFLYFFLGQTWNTLNLPSGHVSWLWLVSFWRGVYPWGNLKSINIWRNFRIPGATIL